LPDYFVVGSLTSGKFQLAVSLDLPKLFRVSRLLELLLVVGLRLFHIPTLTRAFGFACELQIRQYLNLLLGLRLYPLPHN
jgi:hypothetical protein